MARSLMPAPLSAERSSHERLPLSACDGGERVRGLISGDEVLVLVERLERDGTCGGRVLRGGFPADRGIAAGHYEHTCEHQDACPLSGHLFSHPARPVILPAFRTQSPLRISCGRWKPNPDRDLLDNPSSRSPLGSPR